jgi:hypothetical protein
MKKSTNAESTSKISIISKSKSLQKTYNLTLSVLNTILENQIKDKKHKSFNNLKFNNHENPNIKN